MNLKALRIIYVSVLKNQCKIQYHGDDKYTLTSYRKDGTKDIEIDYWNECRHGFVIKWGMDGYEMWKYLYERGAFVGFCELEQKER